MIQDKCNELTMRAMGLEFGMREVGMDHGTFLSAPQSPLGNISMEIKEWKKVILRHFSKTLQVFAKQRAHAV